LQLASAPSEIAQRRLLYTFDLRLGLGTLSRSEWEHSASRHKLLSITCSHRHNYNARTPLLAGITLDGGAIYFFFPSVTGHKRLVFPAYRLCSGCFALVAAIHGVRCQGHFLGQFNRGDETREATSFRRFFFLRFGSLCRRPGLHTPVSSGRFAA